MTAQLFPLLCGLTTVCFCACISRRGHFLYVLIGMVSALLFFVWQPIADRPLLLLNPEELAIVCAGVALITLKAQRWRKLALITGGAMSSIWVIMLTQLGADPIGAAALVFAFAILSIVMALNHPGFLSQLVLDEALMGVFALSLLVGLVPSIVQGWQSASVLHGLDSSNGIVSESGIVVWLAIGFIVCGVFWSWWRQGLLATKRFF